jgi:LmbE family N-acetylglucosaminyl deacetylase
MQVLVIVAHPDDTEYICGGTVASMIARGDEVTYVVVTSGELGLPPDERDTCVREREQLDAASALGVKSVDFLRHPDGQVSNTISLRSHLVRAIRDVRPDLVITHSPVYNLASVRYSHADHLAVGQAAFASVFPESRNARFHSSLLATGSKPWTVTEVWLCGVEQPNHRVDISEYFNKKIEAAAMHESQKRHFPDFLGFFREWAEDVAQRHGMTSGTLAEEFHRINAK